MGRRRGNRNNDPRTRAGSDPVRQAKAALAGDGSPMPPGREAKLRALVRKAEKDVERDRLAVKWSFKNEGTPETHEAIDRVPSRRRQSSLQRMHEMGRITLEELSAGEEIANVIESIERAVSVRCASLEARVDFAASGRDTLVESLGRIRMEVAYRAWRQAIPIPRRMVLDMILSTASYVAIGKRYRVGSRLARKRLVTALRLWSDVKAVVWRDVDRSSVADLYARLGEGTLMAPRPKAQPAITEGAE